MAIGRMTPGRWGVLRIRGASDIAVIPVNRSGKPRDGRDTADICRCEREADAIGIAALPDLIDACKEAVNMLEAATVIGGDRPFILGRLTNALRPYGGSDDIEEG